MTFTETVPYSVKFFGVPIANDEISIYVRIILRRKKTELALDVKGRQIDWDPIQMRFNNARGYNNYLNNRISEAEGKLFNVYISIRNAGKEISLKMMKVVYKGGISETLAPLLTTYIDERIKELKLQPESYTQGTIAHYNTLSKYLKHFLKEKSLSAIRLDEWTRKHFVQFETYLLTVRNKLLKRPISRATANKYIIKLKVIFNHALANEEITIDPIKGFKMERVKSTREYLTADELKRIENHDLTGNESLLRVKYLFLFSVYTGLRFSDAINLKRESICMESDGNHYLEITQSKTGAKLYRPMLSKAIAIFEHFNSKDPDSEYVLPRITNQKVNAYLKVIAELANISKKLTHHIARHTFATTVMLDSGVDLKTTSYFMGHSSIKTTEVYAKITKNRAGDVVRELNAVLG